jgi:hypothetical protein
MWRQFNSGLQDSRRCRSFLAPILCETSIELRAYRSPDKNFMDKAAD